MTTEELKKKLTDMDLRPRSYSGRGMYGRECVGASIDGHPGDYELPKDWRSDSLGKGFIVYWPSVAWEE